MTTKQETVKVGLVGFGTIGTGVAKLLLNEKKLMAQRSGVDLVLARIADLDTTRDRGVPKAMKILTNSADDIINDPEISIVVELVGGTTYAKTLVEKALNAHKNVVTANKALLATYGKELFDLARANGCTIAFEAAVAGGIPIIAGIGQSLQANNIQSIRAILNGTSNFILSTMEETGADYDATVKEAQRLGYAEANPALDVNGSDAAQKLAILAHLSFGAIVNWKDIPRVGIDVVQSVDMYFAKQLGYKIRLLGVANNTKSGLELSVSPTLVKQGTNLSNVSGAFNAVRVVGDAVGNVFFYGKGAGELPTASAVVADILDTAIGRTAITFKTLNLWGDDRPAAPLRNPDDVEGRYYLRMDVADATGVMAQIADILAKSSISIASLLQYGNGNGKSNGTVPMIIMTHSTNEGSVKQAIEQIKALKCVKGAPVKLRILD